MLFPTIWVPRFSLYFRFYSKKRLNVHKTTKYDLIHRLKFQVGPGQRYNIGPRLSLVPYLNYMKALILEIFELDLNQRDTGFLMIVNSTCFERNCHYFSKVFQ